MDPPLVVLPGAGAVTEDSAERRVTLVADRPELVAILNRYASGTDGPEPHVHHEHIDAFWVISGELRFRLGGEPRTLRAGDSLAVAPELAHSFRAVAETRFLNLHARGCGFGSFLRGEASAAEADQHPVPPGGGRRAADAVLVRTDDPAGGVALGASRVRFPLEGEPSFSLVQLALAPGFPGPVPHRHARMTDSFLVLDGHLRFLAGDRWLTAAPGTWISIPPGNVHTFAGDPSAPASLLNVMAPGGLEQYLKAAAAQTPPGAAPDPAAMAALAARYDFAAA